MRLLLTGASGFIGRNLLLKVPREWEVVATYNKSTDFADFVMGNALDNVRAVRVNLTSSSEARRQLKGGFDCAVHLAANTNVQLSVKKPEVDLKMNVLTLLNTVRSARIRDLIFMSSGAVYDGHAGVVSPKVQCNPSHPYAISKLACEHYMLYFKKNRIIENYVVLRFFGAYGPYEPLRKIFSKLVRTFYFENSREFTIVGDGNNFIDAMYVEDAVDAILSVIKSDVRDVIVDFASGNAVTINELVTRVAEIFGKKDVMLRHEGWPPEYNTFYASGRDMEALYGFRPSTPLKEGIWRLARWLKKGCV